ncbi:MAG: NADP-dependent malic enzyme, partial [Bacteroidia bacterium]|nr:NADP-dependent malic enzyme [Bacteroidia bacterium]
EVNESEVDAFVKTVKAIAPTFGGINLEDIKSPECFEIEQRLKEELDIPVMHDDQHGTAIICGAALINALELANKKFKDVKIVVNGAGASAVSCTKIFLSLGAKRENIVMLDRSGVIRKDRDELPEHKSFFATDKDVNTLAEAINGVDVFIGLSEGKVLNPELLMTMNDDPIVFAMANPEPEISYDLAHSTRDDIILATGRSDYPNQVNNVLGFPFIFRGALDVRARLINEEMKLAAVKAIAGLAKEPVPEIVNLAYNKKNLQFGKEYFIPKPLDPRLIETVAPAVAKAAIASGVARVHINDWDKYIEELNQRLGLDSKLIKVITTKARSNPQRVVFAEADTYKILKAAQIVKDEEIAIPILLGNRKKIQSLLDEHSIDLGDTEIIDTWEETTERESYANIFFKKRKRKGFTLYDSRKIMRERNYYGAMMVETGAADALISGLTRKYPDTIRPALWIIGTQENVNRVAGMHIMITKNGPLFLADTTVNVHPTTEELIDITLLAASAVRQFNIQPRIALLSFSNFGSSEEPEAKKVRDAVSYLHKNYPGLAVDGEMQANFAFNKNLLNENFPFSELVGGKVNTLIFPGLESSNISYKMMQEFAGVEIIGPVLLGMQKPVHVLQLGSSVREIVNMVTIAVVDAQSRTPESIENEKTPITH